jgi:signal transduction histidine kinase/CheY-like chemotaxis protein
VAKTSAPAIPIRAYAIGAALAWTAIAAGSFAWNVALARREVTVLAAAQARAAFEKDLAYRRWAAGHGGVYVPLTARTKPNPLLDVPDREVMTTSGRILTLVNPGYMMRQVNEQESMGTSFAGHLTSAHPLRPENRPDAWEAKALARLDQGEREVVEEVGGTAAALRYMGKLTLDDDCISCHTGRHADEEITGGISVSVPMAPFVAIADAQAVRVGTGHAVIWALGIAGIAFAAFRASRQFRDRERERAERSTLEHELAQARRLEAIGQLAGGVAHDLNNLLSPILGNAALALERLAPGEPSREEFEEIREAADRARALTQQLLAFGRKQVLTLEPLEPSAVVAGALPLLRRLLGVTVELSAELAAGLPAVRGDRAQLELVLLNLAANGRDAMPKGGVLRIVTSVVAVDEDRARHLGLAPIRHVCIEVADTGIGMDRAVVQRLFEPFFTTKAPGAGTGLGLASAHGIVRQLGGGIEVESAPGKGSTFRILLPALDVGTTPQPQAPQAPDPSAVPRGTETVLLAEDEPAVRRYAVAALSSLGYSVVAAADGEEAFALVRDRVHAIDGMVCDLVMPRCGGRELHSRLVALRPRLPTVFITGYPREAIGPHTPLPAGALLVQKPFTPADLGRALRRALDSRPLRSAARS